MSAELSTIPTLQFLDDNGNPLSGGQLFTYEAGTTTPKTVYKDQAATESHTNPIILNARGEVPDDLRLLTGQYKFVLQDENDVTIWTRDNIESHAALVNVAGALAVNNNLNDLQDNDTAIINLENGATDGNIVQTSRTQTITQKTIVVANNTITTATIGTIPSTELNTVLGALQTDINTRQAVSTLTTKGDIYVRNGSSVQRVGVGTDGQVLTAASGQASGVNWQTPSASVANLTVASISSATTASGTVDLYLCDTSGGAFTLTLPTASGITGKVYQIKYTDSGFANALTIDGDGSETIDGSTTTTLNTQGETLKIVSDGTNWQILSREIPSILQVYTPTFTSFGTVSSSSISFERIGRFIHVNGRVNSGSPLAAIASMSLPTGLNIYTTTKSTSNLYLLGQAGRNVATTLNNFSIVADTNNSTSLVYFGVYDNGSLLPITPQNASNFIASSQVLFLDFKVEISEWN